MSVIQSIGIASWDDHMESAMLHGVFTVCWPHVLDCHSLPSLTIISHGIGFRQFELVHLVFFSLVVDDDARARIALFQRQITKLARIFDSA